MSTFAQLQKLKSVQPDLKPISAAKTKRIAKKNAKMAQKIGQPEKIFGFPRDIIDLIFFPGDEWRRSRVYQFFRLRLVSKNMKEAFDGFCRAQCQSINYDKSINPIHLYYYRVLFPDAEVFQAPLMISENVQLSKMITYNEHNTECTNCFYVNKLIANTLGNRTIVFSTCAFGCRNYYCENRNCELFAESVEIYDFAKDKNCCDCSKPLTKSYKGENRHRCRSRDFNAPEYVKCEQYDEYEDSEGRYYSSFEPDLAQHACKECRKDHFRDMWGGCSSDDDF